MEYFKQFQNHIGNNDLPSVVNLWQEYCLSEEVDSEEFKQILVSIKNSSLRESFGCYADEGLILWEILQDGPQKEAVIKEIFDIQTTNDAKLAKIAYDYLENKYKDAPFFQQKIKLVGLRDRIAFQYCIGNFELLIHMKVGNFFIHTGGWGVGEVMDISMVREQITLEFDYVAGHKELSFKNAFKTLLPISKEHFLARRFGNPEAFEDYARKNPVETIRLLLADLGPKTAAEIKDEICEVVIPEEEWPRWWQTTRSKLKKDTFIETPSTLRKPFVLRVSEVSHEETLQKALEKSPDATIMIEMIYSFMRDFPQSLKNNEFKASLIKQLTEVLSHKELTDSQEMQILFILQDLGHDKGKEIGGLLAKYSDVEALVIGATVLTYKKRLCQEIKKALSDWPSLFANLILTIDQNPFRDFLAGELLTGGKETIFTEKMADLLDNPKTSPGALLWCFQKLMTKKKFPFSNQEGMDRFFEAFFILMHSIENDPQNREFVKKMLNFLSKGRFANVRKIFKHSSLELTQEILLLCTKCHSLNDHDIKILHSLAEVVHPNLASLRKPEQEEDMEAPVIWTTKEGYQRIKERIEQIATVETVENAKEIEVARSHGDLRENSEYKFAQERRSRLQSELRFLSGQMKQMRVLTEEDIDTNTVSIGCTIDLEGEKGEKTSYTFLGSWDADPDNNILSIQSQVAKELAGMKVGNRCKIKNKEWKVSAIRSFL